MSLEDRLHELINALGTDVSDIIAILANNNLAEERPLSVVKKDKIDGVYTTVEYYRPDNTLFKKSTVSDLVGTNYTKRTVVYYKDDGVTPKITRVYTLAYDSDNDLVSETLQS